MVERSLYKKLTTIALIFLLGYSVVFLGKYQTAYGFSWNNKTPVSFESGQAAYGTGNYKESLRIFSELEELYHQTGQTDLNVSLADIYYFEAINHVQLRNYLDAQNYYSRIIALFPESAAATLAKKGLVMLPHLKQFVKQPSQTTDPAMASQIESQTNTLPDLRDANVDKPVTAGSNDAYGSQYYQQNTQQNNTSPSYKATSKRELPPLVDTQAESDNKVLKKEPPTTLNKPASQLSPEDVQALQQLLKDYQSGKLTPKQQSYQPQPMVSPQATVSPNYNAPQNNQQNNIDPAMLMLMQSMNNNGNNGGYGNMFGQNNNFNNIGAMINGMKNGNTNNMDPNIMSQMLMNQMMTNVNFGSNNNNAR